VETFVDRGGTFTDVVVLDNGRVSITKVPSDRAVVGELARGRLTFGTTVATNALLEGRRAPTLLVVTEGFADLVRIGDMARPELFDPDATWPAPLCDRVVEVPGRIATDGTEIEPLRVAPIDLEGIEAVAVCLINAHANPAHELAVAATLEGVHVALGHRVSPELGYLGRIETTLVDAAITPILADAVRRDRVPEDARAMRSDGSLCPAPELRAPDAVLSGPAGGVLAVAAVAEAAGFERAVGLDMGGTSTDVCRVDAGRLPRREGEVRIAGVRLRRPMLEVETIAAGGGSILRGDGLRLTVGPDSAGADPGPACTGRGGPPTLTDAALLCGLVDPQAFDPPLDPTLVSLPGDAEALLDIAREKMAQAVRRLATARGIELQDHALVAYGGAAGQHACRVAEKLGISCVLVHPCAGVLSAWGQALARREESAVRAIWKPLTDFDFDTPLEVPALGETLRTLECRHVGTDHVLEVAGDTVEAVRAAFRAEHRRRYGFDGEGPLEVVNLRVRSRAPKPTVPVPAGNPWGIEEQRGPAVLFAPTTAVEIPVGWRARVVDGLLRVEVEEVPARPAPTERSPEGVELWGNRFMSVAEQAGEVLRRLARSVNIRERLDFSCAVFDGQGHLVANAPHIPVHLGAMGETVQDLIRSVESLDHGQSWLTNDPAAGGSHLPDLTVVTCVLHEGKRFFVASRGHHVDVGGLTPGSMPPHSRTLAEEGFVVRHVPLLREGRLVLPELPCRQPEVVAADLRAQVAANGHAARLLAELGSASVIEAWMQHLQDLAAETVDELMAFIEPGRAARGPLRVTVERQPEALLIDFAGTGPPDGGNRNAPPAVTVAAVLYVLRCLAGSELPLNAGALRNVHILHPAQPTLLNPPEGAAVVGGNVETSQQVVDLLFAALGERAGSQGTMNNLTLGGEGWSFYETLGGGVGAPESRGPAPSGVQVHMTNTRATDVEVVEARLPLRVRRFALRRGTGGDGLAQGGDGLIREIEVLGPTTASLLASARDRGPRGIAGGGDGRPGLDEVRLAGHWQGWDGQPVELAAGDRVRVSSPGGGGYGRPR